jgi:hypothetical protein
VGKLLTPGIASPLTQLANREPGVNLIIIIIIRIRIFVVALQVGRTVRICLQAYHLS